MICWRNSNFPILTFSSLNCLYLYMHILSISRSARSKPVFCGNFQNPRHCEILQDSQLNVIWSIVTSSSIRIFPLHSLTLILEIQMIGWKSILALANGLLFVRADAAVAPDACPPASSLPLATPTSQQPPLRGRVFTIYLHQSSSNSIFFTTNRSMFSRPSSSPQSHRILARRIVVAQKSMEK